MPLLSRTPLSLLLLALAGGVSAAAAAAPQQQHPRHGQRDPLPAARDDNAPSPRAERQPPRMHQDRGSHSRHEDALSDSVRRIERSTRGQVLSAERVPYDGRNLNRIKVVDDRGRVRVYMDDPQHPEKTDAPDLPPTRGDDD
jgi:hypothetical protein